VNDLRGDVASYMECQCTTIALRDRSCRPPVKDLVWSRPGARWTVIVFKRITPEYQSFVRVRRGDCIASTKHQAHVETELAKMSTSVSTGFAANQEAFEAARQLTIANHNQIMQSLHDPSVDPREATSAEMTPLESWHDSIYPT
jgi:hypothetical protein